MSHFTTVKTKISDQRALLLALRDKGFAMAEVHEEAQSLMGYGGDKRQQTAEVIIRRKFVGRASNDIGFKRTEDGSYDAIISKYDRSKYDKRWLESLTQRYAYHIALAKLVEQGFALASEETSNDGRIHLVLRRLA